MAGTAAGKRVGRDLTEGSVMEGLLVFALPIVLSHVIQQLYSLVDLMVIGHYMGSVGTVGVSTGGEMLDLLTPLATAFGTAGQIYIAQLFGAREERKVKQATGTLVTGMLLLSAVITAAIFLFRIPILTFLQCPRDAFSEAEQYMLVTALGFPFVFAYNGICGILKGLGESKRPLLFVVVAATANIFLDIFFVAVFHWGVTGTALATMLSQFGSCLAAFLYLWRKRERFDFELSRSWFRMDPESLKVILSLGVPQAARSVAVHFSMLWVNRGVNAYGIVASATNGVGNKIQRFMQVFMIGVNQAAGAMVAQNLGAEKQERAAKTVLYTFYAAMVTATVIAVISWFIPERIFGIFTKDPEVIALGVTYMRIMIVYFYSCAVTGSFQAMSTGAGFAKLDFCIGILDGIICRIGFSILFAYVLGLGAVGFFWGAAVTRVIPGFITVGYFLKGDWRTRRLLKK